jgi:hypothetical protein
MWHQSPAGIFEWAIDVVHCEEFRAHSLTHRHTCWPQPHPHTCMKKVCATLSFQVSCSLQNSADCLNSCSSVLYAPCSHRIDPMAISTTARNTDRHAPTQQLRLTAFGLILLPNPKALFLPFVPTGWTLGHQHCKRSANTPSWECLLPPSALLPRHLVEWTM